jgi:mannose-6-phosphate isomerase-like protein (cupin superfamily)
MKEGEKFFVESDSFTRRTPVQWPLELNPVYEIVIAARCGHYSVPFVHDEPVQFYTLVGKCLFDIGSQSIRLAQGQFVYVPACTPYFVRGLEFYPSVVLALPSSSRAEEDWKRAAVEISK